MSINFLKDAKYIRNYSLCKYDSRAGYTTSFTKNGDVDGWDIYNNIYLYGSWNGVLFGSTYDRECYIERTNVFLSLPADEYYHIEFIVKLIDENPTSPIPTLTKGKVQWMRTEDSQWSSDRELEFDIKEVNVWKYYKLNLGPEKWWQGDINNLRFFPFIDGKEGDKFFIKFIRITSSTEYSCINTQCSKYTDYSHPCPWTGNKSHIEADTERSLYTTTSNVNSNLTINVDNYGEESFDLGTNINIRGIELSKIIGNTISTLNIGGYSYIESLHTDNNRIRLTSGTVGSTSSIVLPYSKAAEELGFYDSDGNPTYTHSSGSDPATGFDYASTRHLATYELNRIIDSDMTVAYVHNPNQFSVEGGRRDFNEIGVSELVSELDPEEGYKSFSNIGKTLIDLSHRIDNNGKLTHFWVYGKVYTDSKLKILRPHNDGGFTVVGSVNLYEHLDDRVYTKIPTVYKIDCDILVNKGDLIGIYNTDIFVGATPKGVPDATFCQYSGEVSGRIEKTRIYSYGVGGFAFYARGDLTQNNTILEIDMGDRLNISEFRIFGQELSSYFEFNIASCLDVSWDINLFGNSHNHTGISLLTNYDWAVTHTNKAYGIECLDDGILTADNGLQGDSYGSDNGLATFGDHAYFYVNGDAEWLYSSNCGDPAEFCGDTYPTSITGFETDPIEFTITFPNNSEYEIYKSSMYFKEMNNFRSFELSYFKEPYYTGGNATGNREYVRIPTYTNIALNGASYAKGDNPDIDSYLGKNPTDGSLNISSSDNIIGYISSKFLDWTILEHTFEPIKCKGFRIYCTEHYSTKMTELELYARVINDASLLDNVIIEFSDYGDVWRSSDFNNIDGGISTFIGGTPRYIRLYIESQAKFYINEIDVKVTEQIYVADDAVLLLDDAKSNTVSASKSLDIYNTYDKPFDLTVDIPRNVSLMDNVVYWNKLSEESHISNAEIGPGGILYKSEDFPITAYHGQVANNVPCYGLSNLIHNKTSYYTNNGVDWNDFGTLASGIGINFFNEDYAGTFKHTIEFDDVSAKYVKICCLTSGGPFEVRDVLVYFGDDIRSIKNLYYNEECGTSILTNEFVGEVISFDIDNSIGVKLQYTEPINKIVLISNRSSNFNTRLYTSSNNTFYYYHDDVISTFIDNVVKFAIDLENRHSLDFIRSYGTEGGESQIPASDTQNIYQDGSWDYALTGSDKYIYAVYREYNNLDDKYNVIFHKSDDKGTYWKSENRKVIDVDVSSSYTNFSIFALTKDKIFIAYTTNSIPRLKLAWTLDGGTIWSKGAITSESELTLSVGKGYLSATDDKLYVVYGNDPANSSNYILYISERLLPTTQIDGETDIGWITTEMASSGMVPSLKVIDNENMLIAYRKWNGTNPDELKIKRKVFNVWETDKVVTTSWGYYHTISELYLEIKNMDTLYIGWYGDMDQSRAYYTYSINGGDSWTNQDITSDADNISLSYTGTTLYISYYVPNTGMIYIKTSIDNGSSWSTILSIYSEESNGVAMTTLDDDSYVIGYGNSSMDFLIYRDVIYNYERGIFTSTLNTSFSNSSGDIEDAVFDSTLDDCRWLSLNINCSDVTPKGVTKIGIYSNISKAYCVGGGYNHTWDDLGKNLTAYSNPVNIANGADVSATTDYLFTYYPTNAVDGVSSEHKIKYCWGYEKDTTPELYIDFGQTYLINKIIMHNGYHPDTNDVLNKSYNFSVDNTVSGTNYVNVLNVTGISSNAPKTHSFDPVYARRLKLQITSFDTMKVYSTDGDDIVLKYAGFLRDIEVYTYADYADIDSETYPVVCVHLQDQFNVIDHKLINDNIDSDTDWSNNEQFFRYSDNITDDPKKVSFFLQGSYVDEYYSSASSDNAKGSWYYVFDDSVFIPQGNHLINWDAYYPENVEEISIELAGSETVNIYAVNYGTGWLSQTGEFFVKNDGYFVIKVKQHLDKDNNWGARNPRIYRSQGFSKWLAIKRDTATGYSYDDDESKYGADYLSSIQVYGDKKYNLTEHSWWWESSTSTLSNNYINSVEGKSSLYIEYPTSSDVDIVQFRPGDSFGTDLDWSIYDILQFNLWVSDVNKLDTTFGDIVIGGGDDGANKYYYSWDISDLYLSDGWNSVSLSFDDATSTYTEGDESSSKYLDTSLDLKNNPYELSNLYIRYRGKGDSFNMALDTFKIKRNIFDSDVKFGKGLCLTGHDSFVIPLSNITLDKGTIEFWVKLGMNSFGRDAFGELYGGTLFTLTNNNNDIIAVRINPTYWFEILYGNTRDITYATVTSSTESMTIDRNKVIQMALVWSRDGSGTDNGHTIRFYINDTLILSSTTTWDVEDTKLSFLKLGGGIAQSSKIHSNFSNFFFNNIKIYNYCKDNFNREQQDATEDKIYSPENFIELSKNDVDFYSIGSENLPFVYEQVPAGDNVTIYVRSNKDDRFSGNSSTAQIIIDWLTTV